MSVIRIALANLRIPATPAESVSRAVTAIVDAAAERADLVCFPEGFVPGYRIGERPVPAPNREFLERA